METRALPRIDGMLRKDIGELKVDIIEYWDLI